MSRRPNQTPTPYTADWRPSWWPQFVEDIPWLMVQIDYLRRAGIDLDPTVELVISHPALPDDMAEAFFRGHRTVSGELAVRVQKR